MLKPPPGHNSHGMEEIWKPIVGYEGSYEVSSLGRIKSTLYAKERILRLQNRLGYKRIALRSGLVRKTKSVHRLVAEAFIPNLKNKPEINHKNGIKTDNRVENLMWVTAKENTIHAHSNGLVPVLLGEQRHNSKLKNFMVMRIKLMLELGTKPKDIGRIFNVTAQAIDHIKCGRSWTHIKI